MNEYDVAVLGGGPGGYQAALNAQSKGLKAVLIEKELMGGVCLNWGCIPTKLFLSTAKFYERLKKGKALGVEVPSYACNLKQMFVRKDDVVGSLRQNMIRQLERAGVRILKGTGKFQNPRSVEVTDGDGRKQQITAKHMIVATGSRPKPFPKVPFDGVQFLSSDDILKRPVRPERLVIIGGGAVGVEFATLFHSLGSRVTLVELLDHLIPLEDADLGKRLEASFRRRGIQVLTKAKVSGIVKSGREVAVRLESGESLSGEKVLISIGRMRNTENLGLDEIGVKREDDQIKVNEFLETSVPNVYAIGDVTGFPQLAHAASFGGALVIDNLISKSQKRSFPLHAVPNCIFSEPQAASVGYSTERAREAGLAAKEVRVLLSAQGKSHVEGELEGFVKLVVDAQDETVIGGHILGGEASEMIGVLALAVNAKMKVSGIGNTIFPHPTYHEIIGDAARAFSD